VAPVPLEQDGWPPPLPWGSIQVLAWRDDADALPQVRVDEGSWQPPLSWTVPTRGLLWFDDAASLPPPVVSLDDAAWLPSRPWALRPMPARLVGSDGSAEQLGTPPVGFLDDAGWQPPLRWPSGWPRGALLDDQALAQTAAPFFLEHDTYLPPRPWPVPPRQAWWVADEWVLFVFTGFPDDAWVPSLPWPVPPRQAWWVSDAWAPEPIDGFTGGFSTATLTAMPGGSLLELIGLAPEGYRVRGVTSRLLEAFGTSGGLAALLIGDPVLNDRWGRQDDLTEGAMTNQRDAHSDTEPIAGPGGYALQVAVEGGLMDAQGRIRLTLFWERLTADVV